jgi:hypothetical protein
MSETRTTMPASEEKTTANQALVEALIKFQRWCEAGGPDLVAQLTAATQEADLLRKSWTDLRVMLVDMISDSTRDLFDNPTEAMECAVEAMDSIARIEDQPHA